MYLDIICKYLVGTNRRLNNSLAVARFGHSLFFPDFSRNVSIVLLSNEISQTCLIHDLIHLIHTIQPMICRQYDGYDDRMIVR